MKNRRQEFAETRPGDHVILVYETPAELFAFVVPFIKQGLATGERCIYVAAESKPADVMDALSAGGVAVDREMKRGAFTVMTPREYLGSPPFDPVRVVRRLQDRRTEATSAGFAGLRVADEMSWAGKDGLPDELLGEYEALLEALGPDRPTLACIYRRDRFDPAMLER